MGTEIRQVGHPDDSTLEQAEALFRVGEFAEAAVLLDGLLADPEGVVSERIAAAKLLKQALTAAYSSQLAAQTFGTPPQSWHLTCSLLAWQHGQCRTVVPSLDEAASKSLTELSDDATGIACACRIQESGRLLHLEFSADGCVASESLRSDLLVWLNRLNLILPSGYLTLAGDSGEIRLLAHYCFVEAPCFPQHWQAIWQGNLEVMSQLLPYLRQVCVGQGDLQRAPEIALAAGNPALPEPSRAMVQAQQERRLFRNSNGRLLDAVDLAQGKAPVEHTVSTELGYCGPNWHWLGELSAHDAPARFELQMRWQHPLPAAAFPVVRQWMNEHNLDAQLGYLCLDEASGELLIRQTWPVAGAILLPGHVEGLVRRTFAMLLMIPRAEQMQALEARLNDVGL